MKHFNIAKLVLLASLVLVMGIRLLSAGESGGLPVNLLSFDKITLVRQTHNPGVGPNYAEFMIEGKSGGKVVSADLSINATGTGAHDLLEFCQKNAMLAFHYPDRYTFEILSSQPFNGNNLHLYVTNGEGDNIYCTLKAKLPSIPVDIPVQAIPAPSN